MKKLLIAIILIGLISWPAYAIFNQRAAGGSGASGSEPANISVNQGAFQEKVNQGAYQ
jgi:hypothetical protein